MKRLLELKKKRAEALDKIEALAKRVKDEERLFTDEEKAQLDALEAEERQLAADIEKIEAEEKLQNERLANIAERSEQARKDAASRPATDIRITREEGHDDKGNVCVFRSFGEQLLAVAAHSRGSVEAAKKIERCHVLMRAATGLNETQGSDGGWLVQQDYSAELLKRTYETGVLLGQCRRIGISSNSNALTIKGIDETSRVNGSRWGGVQVYWEGEADAIAASRPKFRTMTIPLGKVVGAYYATEEVLEDAPALAGVVNEAISEEFSFKLEDGVIRGTGNGQLQGVLNCAALVTVAKEGSQSAAGIILDNIVKMRSRLWSRSRLNSRWYINQDCEPQLNVLSLTVGNNSYPVLMPATGISGAPYDTMYGRPVIPIEQCETMGTKGDILLLDLSQYLIIDKGSMKSAESIHVRFLNDERCFKFTYRVGGQPLWHSALTPYKGSNTLSPFVALATRP